MPTYRAQDLANRVTNDTAIFGINSQRESFEPSATYAYNVIEASTWGSARRSDALSIDAFFKIVNTLNEARFDLTRTGVQYDAALTFTPIGSYLDINIDTITIPRDVIFKIRAYKGRPQDLIGDKSETQIPQNNGYIPYSSEYIVDENTRRIQLYLNSLATNDLIAGVGKLNLFILGELDYNNIPPLNRYEILYSGEEVNMTLTVFD